MELEELLGFIPPTIEVNGYAKPLIIKYNHTENIWLCYHQTSKNKIRRKIERGRIAVGKTIKEATENYIKNNVKNI
jgi:hypothetical protein